MPAKRRQSFGPTVYNTIMPPNTLQGAVKGDTCINTASGLVYYYDGKSWIEIISNFFNDENIMYVGIQIDNPDLAPTMMKVVELLAATLRDGGRLPADDIITSSIHAIYNLYQLAVDPVDIELGLNFTITLYGDKAIEGIIKRGEDYNGELFFAAVPKEGEKIEVWQL